MKKFPYKFTTLLKCAFVIGILLAISVIVLNIFKFAKSEIIDSEIEANSFIENGTKIAGEVSE